SRGRIEGPVRPGGCAAQAEAGRRIRPRAHGSARSRADDVLAPPRRSGPAETTGRSRRADGLGRQPPVATRARTADVRYDRPAARTGRMADRTATPADGAGDRQSGLDAPLRSGAGRHSRRLRPAGRAADAPGAARLAGVGVRGRRLEPEEAPPADPDFGRLPAVVGPRTEEGRGRPRQPAPQSLPAPPSGR